MRELFARRRPSAAMLVAFVALIAALSGTAVALPGKNTIDSGDIKKAAVKASDIAKNAVNGVKVKPNSLTGADVKNLTGADVTDDGLTGADLNESSLAKVPSAASADSAASAASVAGFKVIPLTRGGITATDAVLATARAAATKVPLYSKGPFSIYGKCFQSGVNVYVGTYIETSVNGAIFDSRDRELTGGAAEATFLNPTSAETTREVNEEDGVGANNSRFDNEDDNDFSAVAPDGTSIRGLTLQGVKQGTVAFSGGAYGPGDGCLWGGFVAG